MGVGVTVAVAVVVGEGVVLAVGVGVYLLESTYMCKYVRGMIVVERRRCYLLCRQQRT